MLNPENIFCELIGVEYYFGTMKVYPIRLREFKKRQYSSFYLRKGDLFDCPSVTEKPRLGTTV